MKKPTIAVIIPTCNEQSYIKACLDSVINQSRKPDEIIVVDNNSTDKTLEIVNCYTQIKVLKETRQGQVFARRQGFDKAKSTVLVTIDADTILPRSWLGEVEKRFTKNPNAVVTSVISIYDGRLRSVINWSQRLVYRFQKLVAGSYGLFGSGSAIAKADWVQVRDQVHYNPTYWEDVEIGLLLSCLGRRVEIIQSPPIGVSCRRAGSSPFSLLAYLMQWPRTIWLYNRASALFIFPFAVFVWVCSVPFYFILKGSFKSR